MTAFLRAMTEADLEAVAAIELTAYEFPWTLQIFRDCLQAGYDCFVLAENEQIFGYFVLAVAAQEGHVLNIAVAPTYQGQGLGKRLMKRLLDLARWHRADRVFLEVRPSNPRAIGLYYQLGFMEIGRRPRYYPARDGREDAMVLSLELSEPATSGA